MLASCHASNTLRGATLSSAFVSLWNSLVTGSLICVSVVNEMATLMTYVTPFTVFWSYVKQGVGTVDPGGGGFGRMFDSRTWLGFTSGLLAASNAITLRYNLPPVASQTYSTYFMFPSPFTSP